MLILVFLSSALVAGVYGECHFDQERSLSCFLRTLQTDIGASSSAVSSVEKLKITCSDIFFFESVLRTEHFGSLPSLKELDIRFCKIRHLPPRSFSGLFNLEKLTIQSHNTQWASILMDLESSSLYDLDNVQELSLAHNNLRSLPPRTLCSTPRLTSLDLSHNHIVLLEEDDHQRLNLGEFCGTPQSLFDLDLSYNLISSLRTTVIPKSVKNLNLEGNRVMNFRMNSMDNLEKLNLGGNELSDLSPETFKNDDTLNRLTELSLHNNSIADLHPRVFEPLTNLVLLNLSRNALIDSRVSSGAFEGLERLLTLDLSHNRLSQLRKDVFSSLISLEVLILDSNELTHLGSSFSHLTNLRVLSLASNFIKTLEPGFFHSSVKSLSLEGNVLSHLPEDLFSSAPAGCTLETLNLGKNSFRSIPKFVSSKCGPTLKSLDIGENSIEVIGKEDLHNLTELTGLRLADNFIKELNLEGFDLKSLKVLNLARNNIAKLQPGSLGNLTSLKALRLDNNDLTDLNGVVSGLPNLIWLNASNNRLQWFDYGFIPRKLERLDLRYNEISELGNYYKLSDNFNLIFMDVSFNRLQAIDKEAFPFKSLHHIAINNNLLTEVAPSTFAHLNRVTKVELKNNLLRNLRMSSLAVTIIETQELPQMSLHGNPLVCDCEMDWIVDINEVALLGQQHFQIRDLNDLTCDLTMNFMKRGEEDDRRKVIDVEREDFLCPYKTHCFALCMCCDFFACDCRMQCPEGCDCYHDQTWNRNVISCSASNHTEIPLLIPMDATEVRLDGNSIFNVSSQSFHGRHRVRALYLNDSKVSVIGNQTLTGLTHLHSLHLENNRISHLYGQEFVNLKNLRELFLHNNALTHVNDLTFAELKSLSTLTLGGNLLTSFPIWRLMDFNPSIFQLDLLDNPWSCECEFLVSFHRYVSALNSNNNKRSYSGTDVMKCGSPGKEVASRLQECSSSSAMSPRFQNHATDWTPILIPIFVAVMVTVLGFLAVFVFKKHIKNWLYDKSNEIYESSRNSSSSSPSSPKLFDVYINHSTENRDFVLQTLAPTLEHGGNSYRLCVHQRDFPPSNSASLYDTVTVASESSSKILIVLSKAYLRSDWPRVRTPLQNSLKSPSSATNKLILLLLEDLEDQERAYPDLTRYLKICPTIKWGSPGFLNKLRFFLPEPAIMTFQRNVTLRTIQPPKPPQEQQPIYPPLSEHTYQTIPENCHHPLYHTLEEFRKPPLNNPSPPSLSPVHAHSTSTSSGQYLLPTEDSDEYVV